MSASSDDTMSRRGLLKLSAGVAAGMAAASLIPEKLSAAVHTGKRGKAEARLKFGVVGISHPHINAMTDAVIRGGGELKMIQSDEPELLAAFAKRYPNAKVAKTEKEVLEDPEIKLVLSSIIPVERAPLGVRVMQHGKDYLSDKPGIITLEQLAEAKRVQAATKKMFYIMYSEHFEVRAAVKAGELVKGGAIGKVVQTVGLGPHRIHPPDRPEWFWDPKRYGGIITDIGAHQFDQFLFFTGSTKAEIVASQVRNVRHPEHPQFQDFGDVMVKGDGGTGYIRLDWFTPAGLPVWGDGRMTILGTDGYIELRKYVDIAGTHPGGEHLYMVDQKGMQYIDCKDVPLPFGPQFVDDVLNRTETSMTQKACFLATELALKAQKVATKVP
jgi:predicted dehydrogenase